MTIDEVLESSLNIIPQTPPTAQSAANEKGKPENTYNDEPQSTQRLTADAESNAAMQMPMKKAPRHTETQAPFMLRKQSDEEAAVKTVQRQSLSCVVNKVFLRRFSTQSIALVKTGTKQMHSRLSQTAYITLTNRAPFINAEQSDTIRTTPDVKKAQDSIFNSPFAT